MSNVLRFKINGLTQALTNKYVRVIGLDRNVLYEDNTLNSDGNGNVELDIGAVGTTGQGVLVYGDNYITGKEGTFNSFSGYTTIVTQ